MVKRSKSEDFISLLLASCVVALMGSGFSLPVIDSGSVVVCFFHFFMCRVLFTSLMCGCGNCCEIWVLWDFVDCDELGRALVVQRVNPSVFPCGRSIRLSRR